MYGSACVGACHGVGGLSCTWVRVKAGGCVYICERVDYEKGNPEHVDPVALKVCMSVCIVLGVGDERADCRGALL